MRCSSAMALLRPRRRFARARGDCEDGRALAGRRGEARCGTVEVRGHVDRLSGSNHHDGSSEWPLKAHAMRVRSCPHSCPDHEGRTGARAATLSQLVSFVSGTVDGCRARARFSRVTTKVERWSSMPSLVRLGRCGARFVYSILSPQNPLRSKLELTSELTS